ncbi:DUF4360 domain-containing protein [Pseudonocardiaceae bacterium YIM PH 21723]|nr:DUF4360 domain-containing protein [Pseudonocardiaceae bacterium YIM PH 21723]
MEGSLMLNSITAAAMALTLLMPPGDPHTFPGNPAPPPPGKITINVVTVNGSGCPAGTVAVAVSNDNTTFTVTYSSYLAQVGGSSLPADFRKNCQLNLKVNVPGGFTYGIAKTDYRGFAHLEKGATALQQASYYFQGMSNTDIRKHPYNGPLDNNWQATDETDLAAVVYKPCGEERNFNINTELRVTQGTSPKDKVSFMAMDSTDVDINTVYHFAWKAC